MILNPGELLPEPLDMYSLLVKRQESWASKHGIILQKELDEKNREALRTMDISTNLFNKISDKTYKEINMGDGNEIKTGKIRSLHSSCALAVNLFDYWRDKKDSTVLLALKALNNSLTIDLKSINLSFEKKFVIDKNRRANIDVCYEYNSDIIIGLEVKYTENYFSDSDNEKTGKVRDKWNEFNNNCLTNVSIWEGLTPLYDLAKNIFEREAWYKEFFLVDTLQIIKHILGLHQKQKNVTKYELIYIYYPQIVNISPWFYESQLSEFTKRVLYTGVKFKTMTLFDLLMNINSIINKDKDLNKEYIDYNINRYL